MVMVELIPIKATPGENPVFASHPDCRETFQMTLDFYKVAGFHPPWICYYATIDGVLVGSAGYKGKPVNNKIEIAYGTFERFRQKGIGKLICKALVELALKTDPQLTVTARTLPEKNYSTRILEKCEFEFAGKVLDPEDGEVWEWVYQAK
jgi:RimJ/RimL family protein N-acetyltransferase